MLLPAATGDDRYIGAASELDERRTFGGLLLGQMLAAASATTERRSCHSLHLLFAAAADGLAKVDYSVDRVRDGRSFAARAVRAEQGERLVASGLLSFHNGDPGPSYQMVIPDVPPPETLEDQHDTRTRNNAAHGGEAQR